MSRIWERETANWDFEAWSSWALAIWRPMLQPGQMKALCWACLGGSAWIPSQLSQERGWFSNAPGERGLCLGCVYLILRKAIVVTGQRLSLCVTNRDVSYVQVEKRNHKLLCQQNWECGHWWHVQETNICQDYTQLHCLLKRKPTQTVLASPCPLDTV